MSERSGMARLKLPPRPIKALTLPSRIAPHASTVVEAILVAVARSHSSSGEVIEGNQLRLFGNPDGALTLNIGMAPDRRNAGAGFADVAAQAAAD